MQGAGFWQLFLEGQIAPASEGDNAGGKYGVFPSETAYGHVERFAAEMAALSREQEPLPGCRASQLPAPLTKKESRGGIDKCRDTWVDGRPGTGCDRVLREHASGGWVGVPRMRACVSPGCSTAPDSKAPPAFYSLIPTVPAVLWGPTAASTSTSACGGRTVAPKTRRA